MIKSFNSTAIMFGTRAMLWCSEAAPRHKQDFRILGILSEINGASYIADDITDNDDGTENEEELDELN